MRMKNTIILAVLAVSAVSAFAGNEANPEAIELAPIPVPREFKRDIDNPVAFDSSVTLAVDCPDANAVKWLADHFAEWYGKDAPKVQPSTFGSSLSDDPEAYSVVADASGVRIAARPRVPASFFVTIAYMCWACRRGEICVLA